MITTTFQQETLATLRTHLHDVNPKLPLDFPEQGHFKNEWGIDSLDIVEFVARIEDTYDIAVPDEDIPKLYSLEKVIDYLNTQLHEA